MDTNFEATGASSSFCGDFNMRKDMSLVYFPYKALVHTSDKKTRSHKCKTHAVSVFYVTSVNTEQHNIVP